ncbi:MAG TPA: Crp/Fnr family transcriptional regulator [Allosphingosinicella sp.]|uniref:Crp/Fnr family transcriptional regulator n=1 Tax=Allosphingosinicella sp. TaxID=2823234 RepID=UPI002ED7CEBC
MASKIDTTEEPPILRPFFRKLNRLVQLADEDEQAILSLPARLEEVPSGHDLVREGQEVRECCLLLQGYACRHKSTEEGGRQIVSFHLPGDMLDLQHLLFPVADHNVQAVTAATVAWIPTADLQSIALERPAVGQALWRDTLIDASIFREWVLNVGRRDARSRLAHMLCEFAARRQAAGLGSPEHFTLPMSQEQIGDATGLTAVHVNRMLRSLREEGVIEQKNKAIRIVDWEGLRRIGGFDPTYLHAAA